MVVSLVKKQCRRADHLLFTLGVRRLEQMSPSHQHKPSSLRARQHDTRTPKYVGFEYFSISEDKSKIGITNYFKTPHAKTKIKKKEKEEKKQKILGFTVPTFPVLNQRRQWGLGSRVGESLQYKATPLSLGEAYKLFALILSSFVSLKIRRDKKEE